MVFEALKSAGRDRNISLRIVQSPPSKLNPNKNTEELARDAKAEVNKNQTKIKRTKKKKRT